MKNFYEATVIKPELKLDVCVVLTPVDLVPCWVNINRVKILEGMLHEKTTLFHQIPIDCHLEIEVGIQREHHPQAVEIDLYIDQNHILPKYQEAVNLKTCYLNTNNVWTFRIPNFYSWLHNITGQGWII